MASTTLSSPDEMGKIENELSDGDSKSEWIRHSIKMCQHVDLILDEVYESYQREERLELVEKAVREKAVREKVDEIKRENGK